MRLNGECVAIVVSSPAAGADWAVTVPAGVLWRVQGIVFTLVTSATVANRFPRMTAQDVSGNLLMSTASVGLQAASLTWRYGAGPGMPAVVLTATGTQIVAIPTPVDLYVPGGGQIGLSTSGLQAADQYSAITIAVERWNR